MIVLNLDRNDETPLFRQVFFQLKKRMDAGVLKPGFKMPATRELAEKHGLNRSTVYKAYEELWALGYLESRPGSYSYVRKKKKAGGPKHHRREGRISWEEAAVGPVNEIYGAYQELEGMLAGMGSDGVINMAGLSPDPRLLPVEDFRRSLNTALKEQGAEILKYPHAQGYKPLLEFIANRMQIHGISVSPDELLITNGAQNAIDLVMKLLAKPGGPVIVESPTYHTVLPLLKYYNAPPVGIPMTENGLDLEILKSKMEESRPSFLYTIPNFHNPTGITSGQTNREELLTMCEHHGVPIVEDAFEEEMKYFGKVPLSIKSMDNQQVVIYLGTFSKVLFPGIRVGWIAADRECIRRLTAIKKYSDLASNLLVQAALHEFCGTGYYELHLKRIHRIYRKRMQTTLKALRTHLDFKGASWHEPTGGFLVWMTLENTGMTEEQLQGIFVKNSVAVAPGSIFFEDREKIPYPCFRLSISALDESEIEEGIKRLGRALSTIYKDG